MGRIFHYNGTPLAAPLKQIPSDTVGQKLKHVRTVKLSYVVRCGQQMRHMDGHFSEGDVHSRGRFCPVYQGVKST